MPDGRLERYYWDELLRLSGEYYRLWSHIRLGRKVITTTLITEFQGEFGRLETWRESLYAEIRGAGLWDRLIDIIADVDKEKTRASEEIARLEEWETIGVDADTGYMIFYNPIAKKYYLADARNTIQKSFEKLSIVVTYSVETGTEKSHEPLTCEIEAHCYVKERGVNEVNKVISELEDFVEDALEYYFNVGIMEVAIKEGIEYYSSEKSDVAYPGMKVHLSYAHHGKKGKVIEKTLSEFESDRSKFPKREHMEKGGRPKTIKEFM